MEASLQSEVRGGVGVAQQTGVSRRGNVGGRRHRTGTVLLRGSDSLLQGGGPGGGGGGLEMLLVEVDHLWGEPNGSGGLVRLWRVTMFHLLPHETFSKVYRKATKCLVWLIIFEKTVEELRSCPRVLLVESSSQSQSGVAVSLSVSLGSAGNEAPLCWLSQG